MYAMSNGDSFKLSNQDSKIIIFKKNYYLCVVEGLFCCQYKSITDGDWEDGHASTVGQAKVLQRSKSQRKE